MDLIEKIIDTYMEGIYYSRHVDYKGAIEDMYWAIMKDDIEPVIPKNCAPSDIHDALDLEDCKPYRPIPEMTGDKEDEA